MKTTRQIKLKITRGEAHKKDLSTTLDIPMFTIHEELSETSQIPQPKTIQDLSTIKYMSSLRDQSKLLQSLTQVKQWKINHQPVANFSCFQHTQEILQQQPFDLLDHERALILPKKIIDSSNNQIYDPKVKKLKREMNILYECSDQQFEKILQILCDQGIKVMSRQSLFKMPTEGLKKQKPKGIMTTLKN